MGQFREIIVDEPGNTGATTTLPNVYIRVPCNRHLRRKCCICGKKQLTHPGLKMHLFLKDARRYVHVFILRIFSLVTENTLFRDAIVEETQPVTL